MGLLKSVHGLGMQRRSTLATKAIFVSLPFRGYLCRHTFGVPIQLRHHRHYSDASCRKGMEYSHLVNLSKLLCSSNESVNWNRLWNQDVHGTTTTAHYAFFLQVAFFSGLLAYVQSSLWPGYVPLAVKRSQKLYWKISRTYLANYFTAD